jgi:CxxC-x17-CxxC domain-containing protein
MGKFSRDNISEGKGGFNKGRDFRKNDRPERAKMYKAVCAECGKDCEVPFRPTGDKPVYCSECFSNKDTSNKKRNERRDSGRSNFGDKKMFKAVCSE